MLEGKATRSGCKEKGANSSRRRRNSNRKKKKKKEKKRLSGNSNHKLQSPSEHIPVLRVSRKEAKSRLIHAGLRKYSNCKMAP